MNGAPETSATPAPDKKPPRRVSRPYGRRDENPLFVVQPDGSIRPTRRGKRAAKCLMRRAERKSYRKAVREARKLGLRGANGLDADYCGGDKSPRRSERAATPATDVRVGQEPSSAARDVLAPATSPLSDALVAAFAPGIPGGVESV